MTERASYLMEENQRPTKDNLQLYEAASEGDVRKVHKLLEAGAKPNFFYRPEDQKNALHIASEKGYSDIVEVLILHGAEVNSIAAADQTTSLILAAQNHHLDIVERLISAGAHIEAANGYGNTALHEACITGDVKIIEELITAGAPINGKNHKGSTPLHLFCYGENHQTHPVEGMRLLVDNGAEIDQADARGATPLLVCCASGRADLAEFLLKKGVSTTVKDGQGLDAAGVAQFYRHEDMVKLLDSFSSHK